MSMNSWTTAAVVIACVGMIVPAPLLQAAQPVPAMGDVALREGGILVGQVVDAQGTAQAGGTVSIRVAGKEIVRTTTDQNGVFAARGLRGGQYEIATAAGVGIYRAWSPQTAPPSARPGVLVVTGDPVVRGQYGMGVIQWMQDHPWVTATGIAAAIALPLALIDDDDEVAPSSP